MTRQTELVKLSLFLLSLMCLAFSAQVHMSQTKIEMKPEVPKKGAATSKYGCLPPDIKPDTVVETKPLKSMVGIRYIKETVVQRLDKMNARCKAGKLVDAKGREIRFYQLQDCWGNPPADYLEIVERQENELKELRKKYTVIEITCNPSGMMPF